MSPPALSTPTTNALPTFPPPTALLLDMDGVLAEVSKSYREAILATCREYGAHSITHDTISQWKARGGCNNDWKLSLDLIKTEKTEKELTLEEVTETFERFYQGTETRPGLYELESLIPSMETLRSLCQRCRGKMAIVTGRPRKDCMKFLQLYHLEDLFPVCVCMEDGPHKPDPFPVLEACKLLNIQPDKSVIMVGDTPDDVRSAVQAGCRAVGIVTPESMKVRLENGEKYDSCMMSEAMKECGADVVLKPGFEELVEMFPEVE